MRFCPECTIIEGKKLPQKEGGGVSYPPLSLYIHIPFCKQKCAYCDFPSFAGLESCYDDYVEALCSELKRSADLCRDYTIPTVFFGGGTPTVLSPKQLGRLMDVVMRKYRLEDGAEITMEANSGTLDKKMLTELSAMGVNRLSMGLQAWQNRHLKRLGRIHTQEEFVQNYTDARAAGFQNINVDVMFGLPGQTLNDWAETLEHVVQLSPDHLSAYSLTVEEGTPFFEQQEAGTLNLPGEAMDRRMYALARDVLPRFGYHQYEISNFARDGKESRHNLVYWTCNEYLGLGLAAHSYVAGDRFHNTRDMKKYLEARGNKRAMLEEMERLTPEDKMAEFCFMGLRLTRGISTAEFEKRFGAAFADVYGPVAERFRDEGLLKKTDEGWALTNRGLDVANTVFAAFILDKKEE